VVREGERERRNLNIMTGEWFTPVRRHGYTRILALLTMPDLFDDVWLSEILYTIGLEQTVA
jgi:hypothetical protein